MIELPTIHTSVYITMVEIMICQMTKIWRELFSFISGLEVDIYGHRRIIICADRVISDLPNFQNWRNAK